MAIVVALLSIMVVGTVLGVLGLTGQPPTRMDGPVVASPVVAPLGSVEAAVDAVDAAVVQVIAGGSSGSGFLVAADTVVTGWHVVDGPGASQMPGGRVRVVTADGGRVEGRVVFTDPRLDLAVVEVDPWPGAAWVQFADAATIRAGQSVFAVGAPAGLGRSVTTGIVSAPARNDPRVRLSAAQVNLVQTDAAVNPGNSGGPLFNTAGQVVGMLLLRPEVDEDDRRLDGVALALRADQIVAALGQLAVHGDVRHPFLGVAIGPASAVDGIVGVAVLDVVPGSPAAGQLSAGDVVTSAAGRPVVAVEDLLAAVAVRRPGDLLQLQVTGGDGLARSVTVELGDRPDDRM